jgi:hypothetical protein
MRNEEFKMQNESRHVLRAVVCCAFFVALNACKPAAEQKAGIVNKDEIKAKIEEKDVNPSTEALSRKEKSIAKLKQREVPFIQHLPVIEDSQSAKRRTKEEIAHRAIALCLVAVKGEGLEHEKIQDLVKRYDAQTFFTPAERKFIENPSPTQHDRVQFAWRYEGLWTLLWALGYTDSLDYPDKICDVPKAVEFLRGKKTDEFVSNAKLRDLSAILDEADLIYRYDWAVVNARVKKEDAPTGLDGGVVVERHHALNWLIGYMNQDWDDVTTDT